VQSGSKLSYDNSAELGRYEALLQMADLLVRHRSLEELFRDVADRLRYVTPFELITFDLHDAAAGLMSVYYWEGADLARPPLRFSIDQTPSGWVWQHQEVLAIPSLTAEARFPAITKVLIEAGIQSYCCVPLTTARRKLGALGFSRP
jgi:formate hydrogenlyase transcriptional activator